MHSRLDLGRAAHDARLPRVGKLPASPGFLVNAAQDLSLRRSRAQHGQSHELDRGLRFRTGSAKACGFPTSASDGDDLLSSLPALRGSEPTLARLASAFAIPLGIGLAAAGLQSFITSLGHDLAHPARRQLGPVSRRLAVARALAIAFVLIAGFRLAGQSVDARFLLVLPVMLSAACSRRCLALAFMPRATSLGALAALCVASFVMLHFFATYKAPLHLAEFATDAVFAAADGFVVALFIAFLPKWTPREAAPAQPAPAGPNEVPPAPEEASGRKRRRIIRKKWLTRKSVRGRPYAEESEAEIISRSPPEGSPDDR